MFPNTTIVFLIPARGITPLQAQHGQKCSRACPCQANPHCRRSTAKNVVTGLAPVRLIHRPCVEGKKKHNRMDPIFINSLPEIEALLRYREYL